MTRCAPCRSGEHDRCLKDGDCDCPCSDEQHGINCDCPACDHVRGEVEQDERETYSPET